MNFDVDMNFENPFFSNDKSSSNNNPFFGDMVDDSFDKKNETSGIDEFEIHYNEIKNIEFVIKNESEKLKLSLFRDFFSPSLVYSNDIDDEKAISISNELYDEFILKIKDIIDNWYVEYEGNIDNNSWFLDIELLNKTITIKGNGDYPENWNELIDLVKEYELLYKEKTTIK